MKLPRNAQLWLPGLLASRLRAQFQAKADGPVHVLFCIADHYEPDHGGAALDLQRRRVQRWVDDYPRMADQFRDADGHPPQHTFFSPAEVYRPELLDGLSELCAGGYGEVEIHLHHGNDTADNLRDTLCRFRDVLAERHSLLSTDATGAVRYGFVHGNWALDNGRCDDVSCGVNSELTVLLETGCYADFTMPAAPDPAQSRTVNSIYYVRDDPNRPRSYDRGVLARAGQRPPVNTLLMVQGPLTVHWDHPVKGVLPRVDNSALDWSIGHHPTARRLARWVSANVTVAGRPEWVVVKVHAHGAKEKNADVMLGPVMREFHERIAEEFNDGTRYALHYVTSRELANIIRAAEAGKSGNPGQYRDFEFARIQTAPRAVAGAGASR
jgi:hypothetical protein